MPYLTQSSLFGASWQLYPFSFIKSFCWITKPLGCSLWFTIGHSRIFALQDHCWRPWLSHAWRSGQSLFSWDEFFGRGLRRHLASWSCWRILRPGCRQSCSLAKEACERPWCLSKLIGQTQSDWKWHQTDSSSLSTFVLSSWLPCFRQPPYFQAVSRCFASAEQVHSLLLECL